MSNLIRTNNSNVARLWANSVPARSSNDQFSTDGHDLYSYRKLIGKTIAGEKIIFDYTAPAGHCISQTTSCHVSHGKRYADQVMDVDVAKEAGLIL